MCTVKYFLLSILSDIFSVKMLMLIFIKVNKENIFKKTFLLKIVEEVTFLLFQALVETFHLFCHYHDYGRK